jgi:hypothetical protein
LKNIKKLYENELKKEKTIEELNNYLEFALQLEKLKVLLECAFKELSDEEKNKLFEDIEKIIEDLKKRSSSLFNK